MPSYLSSCHLEPRLTGRQGARGIAEASPERLQQMSSGLEGHMLPGLLWEARQPVIEFNTSPFSPQLPVQGPSFKLFRVTFCLVILFLYLIRAAPVQLQLCCRLYLISERQTRALTPRVRREGASDGSLSALTTSAMEVRSRSRHQALLSHCKCVGISAGCDSRRNTDQPAPSTTLRL